MESELEVVWSGATERRGECHALVVHDYGDVCQSITDFAVERRATVSADDFHTLNRCLDAIASAVTEFESESKHAESSHELRTLCTTALVAFDVIEKGKVGVSGSRRA